MTRAQLSDNTALTCITTDRFKTSAISIYFDRMLKEGEASQNALLPYVMQCGSRQFPEMRNVSNRLAELYGATMNAVVRKRGERHCFGLYADFVSGTDSEDITQLLFDVLYYPTLSDDHVLAEKERMMTQIRSIASNKWLYASHRHEALAFAGEPYAIPRLGTEEALTNVTPDSLRAYYKDIFVSSKLELFYCGPLPPEYVSSLLLPFAASGTRNIEKYPDVIPKNENVRVFLEDMPANQAQVSIIWRSAITMDNPDYMAAVLACYIYGGSTSSKLFTQVRERLSLCYTTNAVYDRFVGAMFAQAGVAREKLDTARDEMLSQWGNVVAGNFTSEEMNAAKSMIISEIKTIGDSPAALESYWQGQCVCGLTTEPVNMAQKAVAIKSEDIIRAAGEFRLDSIYYLRADI